MTRSRTLWWGLFAICSLYAAFALQMGVVELLSWAGATTAKDRGLPAVFVVHALVGSVTLLAGPLQFHAGLRRHVRWHRAVGTTYAIAVWVASLAGLASAVVFDVTLASRIILAGVALVWATTTGLGVQRVLAKQYDAHRAWMARSLSATLFFITFSLWVPAFAALPIPEPIGYPMALLLSIGLNLLVAELWIQRTRRAAGPRTGVISADRDSALP